MGKRTKLILGIVIFAVILFSGTIFALAKAGKINIKSLADTLGTKALGSATVSISKSAYDRDHPLTFVGPNSYAATLGANPSTFTNVPAGVYTLTLDNGYLFTNGGATGPSAPCASFQKFQVDTGQQFNISISGCGGNSTPTATATTSAGPTSTTSRNFQIQGAVRDSAGKNFVSDAQIEIIDNSTGRDVTPKFSSIASCAAISCFPGVAAVGGQYKQYNYQSAVFARPQNDTYKSISINITSPTYPGQVLTIDLSKPNQIVGTKDSGGIVIDQVLDLQFATIAPPATNTYINGKIIDSTGAPITTNLNVYAKKGGFRKPWKFNNDADFSPYDFNAVSDSSGNYKLDISPQQLADGGNDLEICAMVSKFPTDLAHKNWGCYQLNGNPILHVNKSQNYNNINIKIANYDFVDTKFDSFTLVANLHFDSQPDNFSYDSSVKCDNCSQGPWFLGQENEGYELAGLWEAKDIYNIAKAGSTVDRLKIVFGPSGQGSSLSSQYYFDQNNNFINDDSQYPEILPSDITNSAYINPQDHKLYLRKDLFYRKVGEARDKFVFLGQVVDEGENTLAGAKVTLNLENSYPIFNESGSSMLSKDVCQGLKLSSSICSTPLALLSNQKYVATFTPPGGWQLKDPSLYKKVFSKNDLSFDSSRGLYYLQQKYILTRPTKIKVNLDFYSTDATGVTTPVNISKETILSFYLFCSSSNKPIDSCLDSSSNDPAKSNRIVVTIDSSKLISDTSLSLDFRTNHYQYYGGEFKSTPLLETYDISLMNLNLPNPMDCREFGGIQFCANYGAWSAFIEYRSDFVKIGTVIKEEIDRAGGTSYPIVDLIKSDQTSVPLTEALTRDKQDFGKFHSVYVISIYSNALEIDSYKDLIQTFIHETGHILDHMFPVPSSLEKQFEKGLKAAQDAKCDDYYNKYNCFSEYGIRTNQNELRQEFLAQYLTNNKMIQDAISDKSIPLACRTTLQLLYTTMHTRFPHLVGWQVDTTDGSKDVSTQSTQTKSIDATVSDTDFDAIMTSAGMHKVTLANYQTIAPLSDLNLTAAQIISGVWLKENYDKLPAKQKLQLQLNILTTRASNSIALGGNTMRATLATLNTKAEAILKKLGFHISTASISGDVEDQDGPVAGMEVSFGSKVAVTDALGKYKLSRVPTGKFVFKVSDPKINKVYKTPPDSLTIADKQQMNDINILFTRSKYTIKGQIFYKNAALANGKIIISNGQTIALDANGKFNFQLKQGQYKFIIRNKNNKNVSVSNPGDFGNLVKLNVTKNFNSLIWTY